jgi:DNA-binding NarL/FixJ family response regulator
METLTPRELEVLKLICDGYSTRAIAAHLQVSFKTVACHRSHILAKAGVCNSVQLLRWAIKLGYVTVEVPASHAEAHRQRGSST